MDVEHYDKVFRLADRSERINQAHPGVSALLLNKSAKYVVSGR